MSDYEFLSITKNKLILFLVITLSVAFVICLIMISVYACQPKATNDLGNSTSGSETGREARVSVNDFLFEEYALYAKESKYYLFREQMKQWSEEQVKKYFTPAEEILRDFYKKKNDNTVKEMFETIQ